MTSKTLLNNNASISALPKGWEVVQLEDVVNILDSQRAPINAKEREKRVGQVPYYGATGQVGWIDDHLFDEELVLLGEDGAPFLDSTKQKAYIIRGKSWVNNHAHVLRARNGIPNRYIKYYLDTVDYHDFVTGTTRLKLNQAMMRRIPVPVAPPNDQKLIVAEIEKQFSRLDEAVANLKRVKANLKRYKAAVLKAAVEGKLTDEWRKAHPDIEPASELLKRILADRKSITTKQKEHEKLNDDELPQLPHGWLWVRMADVGDIQLGRQRAPRYHKGPNMRPYLRVQNVFEDRIDTSDVMEMDFPPADYVKYRLEPGDILLNEGQSPELLGRPAIYKGEVQNACFTNTLIRFKTSRPMKPEYPLIVYRGYMRTGRFTNEGTITTNIAHLSAGRFASIEFPLPPLEEQAQIVVEIAQRMSLIESLEMELIINLKRAERLRQAILKKAFSGRLVN